MVASQLEKILPLPASPKCLSQPLMLLKGPSQIFCSDEFWAMGNGCQPSAGKEVCGCQGLILIILGNGSRV
jgi:hypothetical protein